MNRFGTVFLEQGKYREALDSFEKSLKYRIQCFGTNHVRVAATYKNVGVVHKKLGNLQKALELYELALEIELNCLGERMSGWRILM